MDDNIKIRDILSKRESYRDKWTKSLSSIEFVNLFIFSVFMSQNVAGASAQGYRISFGLI